jgi:hypothetical protein
MMNLDIESTFYLLKGKVNCGECSGLISWYSKKGYTYRRCNHYRECTQTTCAREGKVEVELLKVFSKFKINMIKLKIN